MGMIFASTNGYPLWKVQVFDSIGRFRQIRQRNVQRFAAASFLHDGIRVDGEICR